MSEAENLLLPTRPWYARSPADADLGSLYLRWAAREQSPGRRRELAEKASSALALAVQDEPGFEPAWVEAAIADKYLGKESDALANERRANKITASSGARAWANFYYSIAPITPSPDLRTRFAQRGAEIYDSLARNSRSPADRFDFRLRQAALFRVSAQIDKAIAASKEALAVAPPGRAWEAEKALGESELALGDIMAALNAIKAAIRHAPPANRPPLERQRDYILSR
jgi:tetratricopeptide (TPR) repeat protein